MDVNKSSLDIETLKRRVSEGDILAYEKLYKQVYPRLRNYANKLIQNPEAAEEIAADVLINIWKNRENLSGIDRLDSYIYRSIKNACLNFQRDKKLQYTDLALLTPVNTTTPESICLTAELKLHIQQAVQKLPPKCRDCYVLVKDESRSYKEAAEILGVSVKTVDAQLVIALRKMLKHLTPFLK